MSVPVEGGKGAASQGTSGLSGLSFLISNTGQHYTILKTFPMSLEKEVKVKQKLINGHME